MFRKERHLFHYLQAVAVLVTMIVGSTVVKAQLVPVGHSYTAPAGAFLVLEENYGSDTGLDGQGGWTSVGSGNSITVLSDCVALEADNSLGLISEMLLPFNCYTTDYVIDMGIKQWTTINAANTGIWSGTWGIHSSSWGNGPYYRAVMRNDSGGVIGPRNVPSEAAFPVDTVNVLRFSGNNGHDIFTNANAASGGAMVTLWNGGSTDRLRFFSEGTNGQCTVQLAWIKIYTDVDIDTAPLEQSQANDLDVPLGYEYLPPTEAALVFEERYGNDNDGAGSWTGDETTINAESLTIVTGSNGTKSASMPLPLALAAGDYDWVIDVAVKSWSSSSPTWANPCVWNFSNTYGNQYRWIMKNVNGGEGFAWSGGAHLPVAKGVMHVIRFSGKGTTSFYVDDNATSSDLTTTIWGGTTDKFRIFGDGNQASCTIDLAWIRMYTGVEADTPPLALKSVDSLTVPEGYEYLPPTDSTLVFFEHYGSEFDGMGTWTATESTVDSQSLLIKTQGTGAKTATLPLPIDILYGGYDWVIDIGLENWSSNNAPGIWASMWYFNAASNPSQQFILTTTNGGSGFANGGSVLPFAVQQRHVLRFSGSGTNAFYVDAENTASVPTTTWGSTQDSLVLKGGSATSSAQIELAWIRMYTGTEMDSAPLDLSDPNWCGDYGTVYQAADLSGPDGLPDCYVDMYDMVVLSDNWLNCNDPENVEDCQ